MKHLIYIILALSTFPLLGQVTVQSHEDAIPITGPQLRYLILPKGEHPNFQNIEKDLSKFKKVETSIVNLGFETNDVWFYFETSNTSNARLIRMLRLSNPIIDEVDVYKWEKGRGFDLKAMGGDQRPFAYREGGSRQLIFPMELDPNAKNRFLFRVNNGGEQFYFQSTLEKSSHIQVKTSQNQVFYGLLFGIMLFIVLLNLSIGVLFRQRIAYIYTFYGLAFGLLQLSLLGFGTTWLWTDQYFISNRANPILATLGVFFFLRFTYRFLNLKENAPRIKTIVILFEVILLTNVVISLIPGSTFMNISAILVNVVTLLLNLFIIYPLVLTLRKGYRPAKAYMVAFSILQLSVFAFVLRNFGVIPNSFLAENGLQIGSAVEMIILTFGILQRFKHINDEAIQTLAETNELKEALNIQLEEEVKQRTQEVMQQRNELAEKNNEILDSIQYARRIQEAILPSRAYYRPLFSNMEFFYHPKDIIAGDFYWVKKIRIGDKRYHFAAVADCTGHGVPGAMLSVLCVNALDECARLLTTASTGQLLEDVCEYMRHYLRSEDEHIADGMDISVLCVSEDFTEIKWSGANNPLWVFENDDLVIYPPTRRPVGKSESTVPFAELTITPQENQRFYLFSDGCTDQFGGPQGKKLKPGGLKKMILQTAHLSINDQVKTLEKELLNWKNGEEQTDDICFMAIAK